MHRGSRVAGERDVGSQGGQHLGDPEDVLDILPTLLPTPRAIDRLLAQLRYYLVLLDPAEIDDEDVILLSIVRASFPQVYDSLPRWRSRLLSGHSGELAPGADLRLKPAEWGPLLQSVPDRVRAGAERLLGELFPRTLAQGQRSGDEEGSRRICHEEYFDRYFAMSILPRDLPDAEVADAVRAAVDGRGDALAALVTDPDRSRAGLAVSKARRVDGGTSEQRLTLLSTLSEIVDEVDDDRHVFVSGRDQVISWMAGIVQGLNPGLAASLIDDALSSALVITRLRVWGEVVQHLGRWPRRPAWMHEVSRSMIRLAVDGFSANLGAGDGAPADDPAAYYAHCAVQFGGADDLRAAVGETASAGATLGDLAARLVSTRTVMGAHRERGCSRGLKPPVSSRDRAM